MGKDVHLIKESNEVYYPPSPEVVVVDSGVIDFLKQKAEENPRHCCRLCLHGNTDDRLHEMLIVQKQHMYVPPHKHLGKSESFHMLEGDMGVVLFDEAGKVERVIRLCAPGGGRAFCYRLGAETFHTVVPLSAWAVFHEVTNGPFRREEMVKPSWAPADGDEAAQKLFLSNLLETAFGVNG